MISIRTLLPSDYLQYDHFLGRATESSLYYSLEFRGFLESAISGTPVYLIACDEDANIVGSLPLFTLTSPIFGTIANSLPWYGSHGGCLLLDPDQTTVRTELLKSYCEYTKNFVSSTLVLSPFEQKYYHQYSEVIQPSLEEYRVGQVTQMPANSEHVTNDLFSVIHQKTRNLVRKSLKQGFDIVQSDCDYAWNFLYETHVENMLSICGKPKPFSHFKSIRSSAIRTKLYLAKSGSTIVASLLLFYYGNTVEYITPVIKQEYRSRQPLSFLIFNAMLDAIKLGYRNWNWGGTWASQHSLHHFKSGWGASSSDYSYLIRTKADSHVLFLENIDMLSDAFPYYFVYPFSLLK